MSVILAEPYNHLKYDLAKFLPEDRLVTDPLRTLAYGTDASFYRMIPQIVAVVEDEEEVVHVLQMCRRHNVSCTFRAAGTSLSGQAVTDSVLVLLGDGWRGYEILDGGQSIKLRPGVIGAQANQWLAPFGRKIGPDPASINAAMIGGIAANNSSGMCCGTAQNSYKTLKDMRVILADGSLLDTADKDLMADFRQTHHNLLAALENLAKETKANTSLADRIRNKFKMKNTTGYSLNALVDYDDPIDILSHLMIGSEGTLGFIAEITYETVVDHKDKASALALFPTIEQACIAVQRLKETEVAAVELMDRPALRSVEDKAGMPPILKTLPDGATALLIEARAENDTALDQQIASMVQALEGIETIEALSFTKDPQEIQLFWNIRKGLFPSIGAIRKTGTTVIIEDIAFPIQNLAAGTLDLQKLLLKHGYTEAIIFGHALEGNLHFVFTQGFDDPAEVQRYEAFMDEVCRMVVNDYDGALKAEHGTGRNMAPYVQLEWGEQAFDLMKRIKAIFDPETMLNPGVIINPDPKAHVQNLKPLPPAHEIVDKCIECGFCEPKCPSRGFTLSPRQRIVGWREMSRRTASGESNKQLKKLYDFMGIDTCAACGLCATACPVGIETGALIKVLRGERRTEGHKAIGQKLGHKFDTALKVTRSTLGLADATHGLMGSKGMQAITDFVRSASGGSIPLWTPAMPSAIDFQRSGGVADGELSVVYVPSCASRTMGPARGDEEKTPLPEVVEQLCQQAGFKVVYPTGLDKSCCGQPFESKGLAETALHKAQEMELILREASRDGAYPIVFDTSPCAFRMRQELQGRLPILDLVEFLHDNILPRVTLHKQPGAVMLHNTCSGRKMGLESKLQGIAEACAEQVVVPDHITCCGFAGDKGFTTPELNAHALRTLPDAVPTGCSDGYSSSRTCEIGLSHHSGVTYRSIAYLVQACMAETEDA